MDAALYLKNRIREEEDKQREGCTTEEMFYSEVRVMVMDELLKDLTEG
jgi:hypothetical protein